MVQGKDKERYGSGFQIGGGATGSSGAMAGSSLYRFAQINWLFGCWLVEWEKLVCWDGPDMKRAEQR